MFGTLCSPFGSSEMSRAFQACPREMVHHGELAGKLGSACGGEQIGTSPIVVGSFFLDPAALVHASESSIERSGSHGPPGKRFDVFHDRVAVLGFVCETDEDEQHGLEQQIVRRSHYAISRYTAWRYS